MSPQSQRKPTALGVVILLFMGAILLGLIIKGFEDPSPAPSRYSTGPVVTTHAPQGIGVSRQDMHRPFVQGLSFFFHDSPLHDGQQRWLGGFPYRVGSG